MASLNRVLLIGRVTRDPEIRNTPKGTPVAELGLAINRTWTDDRDEKREEVTFVDVTLWNRVAETAQQYLRKGSPVFIEGRLQLDTWEDKQSGQKHSRLRVIAQNLQLLGQRSNLSTSTPAPVSTPEASRISPASARPARTPIPEPDLDVEPF
jgi:single-strand DNA-binding protein